MSRQPAGITGEHHSPRHIADTPPQLAANKVTQTAKAKTKRHQRCGEIGNGDKRLANSSGIQPYRDGYPHQTAMEGHSSFPNSKQPQGVCEPVAEMVKQHIAGPTTKNYPKSPIGN